MLDAASRVPFLARYPERFGQGERCDSVTTTVDVMPTWLAAAGVAAPEECAGVDAACTARGESCRSGIIVQYSEGPTGLYGYVTDDWKYAYSAADGREWLFRRAEGQPEERNLADNVAYDAVTAAMREALIGRLREDGATECLEGDGWKVYPKKEVPEAPDAWQLFQEGGAVDAMFPEGYEPRCKPEGGLPVKGV